MKRTIAIAALLAAVTVVTSVHSASARTRTDVSAKRHQSIVDANGNRGLVISHKTGAKAYVSPQYASRFQSYINDLEDHGAQVFFMGGYRPGRCSSSSLHPCGKALDVCQLRRGRVDSRCHLPDRRSLAVIAEAHGLFEGGKWCNSDYGHAQIGTTAEACGNKHNLYAAVAEFKQHLGLDLGAEQ